jgi:adenylate cyclase
MDPHARALFIEAEMRAERILAILRFTVALTLSAVFVLTIITRAQQDDAMLAAQIAVTSTTAVAVIGLGAISFYLAVPCRFRTWMPWGFATGDAGLLIGNVALNLATTGVPGNYVGALPSVLLVPLVLAYGALQYSPMRLAYSTALLAGGLVAIAATVGHASDSPSDLPVDQLVSYFSGGENSMRLAVISVAGVVLATAAARTRSLLRRAIDQARRLGECRTADPDRRGDLLRVPSEKRKPGDARIKSGHDD